MTVLRRSALALALALTTLPLHATPSSLVEAFASCAGRMDAAFAPFEERAAIATLLEAAMPAALDWGMPASHVSVVRSRAHELQMSLQNDALFGRDPRIKKAAAQTARTALKQCRDLITHARAS